VAAEDVFDARPDVARDALRKIEVSGRAALAELRRLLETVRPDTAEDDNEPQPGLDRLDALAESVQAAGLEVVVRREGAAVALPAGVDLSAYRIVQEALTNTLRHAGASRAEVTVRYGPREIGVEVVDDGAGVAAGAVDGESAGHGIVGMRERAALVGGTVEVGAAPGGGFRVRADLPLGTGT
jgi:signal transduction histidine kinase